MAGEVWYIYDDGQGNKDLRNIEAEDIVLFKEEFPINTWKLEDSNLQEYYMPNVVLLKKEFPLNTWKFDEDSGLMIFEEKDLAKFKHKFPLNIWKLEEFTDRDNELSIIYMEDLAYFKKEFPWNVFNIEENYRNDGTVLKTHTDHPELLGAFAHTPITTITIPLQVQILKSESFFESSVQTAYVPNSTIIEDRVFPPSCTVIRYDTLEELEQLKNNNP